MIKKSNKMLFIAVAAAIALCVPIIMKSKGVKHEKMEQIPSVASVPNPTGDTTADTLATVQAEVENLQEKTKKVLGLNQDLTRERENNRRTVDQVAKNQQKVDQNLRALNANDQEKDKALNALQRQLDEVRKKLAVMGKEAEDTAQNGLPKGFGFDGVGLPPVMANTGSWQSALDENPTEEKGGLGFLGRKGVPTAQQAAPGKDQKVTPIKMLTVADNGTGLDSVALTALVGRIPVKGTIPDPYEFKLIMGRDNIMANGLDLPEVEGMIWSGVSKGDWNLSCVSGELYSVTFIFRDGTIVTKEADEGDDPLGWISDEYGFPCISGKFVTNAPAFLSQRAGLAALGTAGSAYAEAQTTTRGNLLGTESFVSGATGKYVLGQTVNSVTQDISNWLLERQQQSYDAVVAVAGVQVGIHVKEEIQIDYDLEGRKLRYEQISLNRHSMLP